MEVLRAKIAKRISLEQRLQVEAEIKRKLYFEQSEDKNKRVGPQRL